MYEESIRDEFTHQSGSFANSPAMAAADTLGALVELAPADAAARWLETACGPGLIARALAPRVGSVHGVDLTRRCSSRRARGRRGGLDNVSFSRGDATELEFADDELRRRDHPLQPPPHPGAGAGRRRDRPASSVPAAGSSSATTSPTRIDGRTLAQEIERLRDPSHWACLTLGACGGSASRPGSSSTRSDWSRSTSTSTSGWNGAPAARPRRR